MPEAAEQFYVLHRQIQPVAAGIFQRHAFVRSTQRGDRLQTRVAADPVIDMDDQIAGRQALRLGQEVLGPPLAARRADQPVAQHVLFGDHRQARCLEPVFKGKRCQEQRAGAVRHVADVASKPGTDHALIFQKPLKPFPRAVGIGGQDHLRGFQADLKMIRQGFKKIDLLLLTLGRKVAADPAAGIDDAGAGALRQRRQLDYPVAGRLDLPSGVIEVEEPRRTGLVDTVGALRPHRLASRVVLVGDAVPTVDARGRHLIVQHHAGTGQVVEDRLHPVVEEGQPVLHPGVLAAGADRLVQRIVAAGGAEFDAIVLPEPDNGGVIQDDLGHRRKLHHIQLLRGALCRGVEPARAVEHVAEEIQPHGAAGAGRIDVDDPAAHRIVARFGHRGGLREPHADQEIPQPRLVHTMPDPGGERRLAQNVARGQALGRGVDRGQQDKGAGDAVGESRQRRHPRRRDLGVGRDAVEGQAIPCGKFQHREVGRKEAKCGAHCRHPLVVARHMQQRRC
jgi:hypothetical protein